jgi:hypothetical protein
MAERNWGALTSGATFEALATTIVFFEDSGASLFGRRGKDGGQDARSSDATRVFQAKHHENGSAAAAIRDAKNEAKKIAKYRQAGHTRHAQWEGVTHWRLVTNAAFNPTDKLKWDTEVVPLFRSQGLVADYWERAALDGLLDKHPEIHRSFFGHETRVFLSIPEVKDRLPYREPFLRRDELGPFCGRTEEKTRIREFLSSDSLFLVVHGAGGTGKTRLLVEAGDEISSDGEWQVLWANVESMATTSAWFEAVVPERATLLIVDEPADETLLGKLSEQLGGHVGRCAKWKVAVSVRSPKDPVLRFLRGARMKQCVDELVLSSLPLDDAEAMCYELLRTGKLSAGPDDDLRNGARELSTRFARFPVWLTLAVKHLEDHGNLKQIPADAMALADDYLREVEQGQAEMSAEEVRGLLRWVALLGPVNREDDASIGLVREGTGASSVIAVRQRLAALIHRGALSERGARNRYIELIPDVLRDHVLIRWLTTDVGGASGVVASEDAEALLENVRSGAASGSLSALGRTALVAIARTELLMRFAGHDVRLLSGFLVSMESALPLMGANQRVALAEILEAVAPFHPTGAASLAKAMRQDHVQDEVLDGLFGPKVIGQSDVVLSLAWPLFHGAMGAASPAECEAVLRELCALVEAEAHLASVRQRELPNDGKRAAALIARVVEGGPQFVSDYDDAAKTLCSELIASIGAKPPTVGQVALMRHLVRSVLALERRQSWNDDRSFSWRTVKIVPGTPAWATREDVLARVKAVLAAESTPIESRMQLWHVYSRAGDGTALEKLRWTHGVLEGRSSIIKELVAAREVWDWHRRYETSAEVKAAADALELLYASNDLAREFQPLLPNIEDWTERDDRASAKAADLARASSPNEISAFLDRAEAFGGSDQTLLRLGRIAWSLGEHAELCEVVREFIRESLKPPTIDARAEFVVAAAGSWVAAVRGHRPERAHVLVRDLLDGCGSDERRAHLLERLYGRVPKLPEVGRFTAEERDLLRNSRCLFASAGRDAAFVAAIALSAGEDWPTVQTCLEDVLKSVPAERLTHSINALVSAFYWAVRDDTEPQPPTGVAEWLMSQILALPDLDDIGSDSEWKLTEILKRLGKPDVRWLPQALRLRQGQESANEFATKTRAISHSVRVSKYVRQVDAACALDDDVVAALNQVLDFVNHSGSVHYYLPEILHDVDPEGLVVPAAVEKRAVVATDAQGVRRLARLAGGYAINSVPWRTIACATIRAATRFGGEELRSVYGALEERGVRSWSSEVGEVPPAFIAAVTDARAALEAEAEVDLRPFWQQRLAIAEAELRDEEERAKEDRDE